ncbi:hypothetical protein NJB14197_22300 [Mycobacterium montefiorense]|uniref:Uncharacterized protein n=1 Tax=Mycobacterium montefiorense TaxID=154654 RepID=A0AA37PN82_9MYCO|nr:hypothetical protein MmonteBS_18420 [Mycobacterium montefiorense]GKU35722.1 hypothetical protein NJB14191_30680 [Mycobacterium montefiorense]GKU38699.1 hypothetical protein NJB14192_06970 [Mycobacterium montefiorense]GKU47677.1 hypothetical protein NJB14194_42950 [Mycobacterium montefiorense]GKU51703.1 hypothetical protein NJB14195_29480 [Mycobacterium montefiorense]
MGLATVFDRITDVTANVKSPSAICWPIRTGDTEGWADAIAGAEGGAGKTGKNGSGISSAGGGFIGRGIGLLAGRVTVTVCAETARDV